MSENLMVGTHKHHTKQYQDGHERTFGKKERDISVGRKRYIFNSETKKMEEVSAEYEPKKRIELIQDLDASGREYQSPVTMKWITSRTAMKEDLKASGCRQVDPSERQRFDNNRR